MSVQLRAAQAATLGCLLAWPATGLAQVGGAEIGIFGGPNRNTVTGIGPATARVEGQLGAFAAFALSPRVSLRSEISVSRKQIQTPSDLACPADSFCLSVVKAWGRERTTFTWLEVPLLAQVSAGRPMAFGMVPRLAAGPFVAVRLGGVACNVTQPFSMPEGLPAAQDSYLIAPCDAKYGPEGAAPANNGDAGFVLAATARWGSFGLGARWTRSLVEAVRTTPFGYSRLMGGKHSTLALTIEMATSVGR